MTSPQTSRNFSADVALRSTLKLGDTPSKDFCTKTKGGDKPRPGPGMCLNIEDQKIEKTREGRVKEKVEGKGQVYRMINDKNKCS